MRMISAGTEASWRLGGEGTNEGHRVKRETSKLVLEISGVGFFPQPRSDTPISVACPSESHTDSPKSLAIGTRFVQLSFHLRGCRNHGNEAYAVSVIRASL